MKKIKLNRSQKIILHLLYRNTINSNEELVTESNSIKAISESTGIQRKHIQEVINMINSKSENPIIVKLIGIDTHTGRNVKLYGLSSEGIEMAKYLLEKIDILPHQIPRFIGQSAFKTTSLDQIIENEEIINGAKKVFSMMDFNYEDIISENPLAPDFNIFRTDSSLKIGFKVKCFSTISNEELLEYFSFFHNIPGDLPLIIITKDSASTEVQLKALQYNIQLAPLERLINNILDFGPYVRKLIDNYKNNEHYYNKLVEKEMYIDPLCSKTRDYSINSKNRLQEEVINLISDRKPVLLLGDFGIGKTTFCSHLSYMFGKQYLEDPISYQIPIYIELGRFERKFGSDLETFIISELIDYVPLITKKRFQMMRAKGRFLFIFDALDELLIGGLPLMKRILLSIRKFFKSGDVNNMLIVTCRSHFFQAQVATMQQSSGFEVLYIHPWNDRDRSKYLNQLTSETHDMDNIWNQYHGINELSKTPLFLTMILETFENIQSDELDTLTELRLFKSYVERWLQTQDIRSILDPEEKLSILKSISMFFLLNNKSHASTTELFETTRSKLIDVNPSRATTYHLGLFTNDILTCSLLVVDQTGLYRFSHYSFYEYLVSQVFIDYMRAKNVELFKENQFTFHSPRQHEIPLSDGIMHFLNLEFYNQNENFELNNVLEEELQKTKDPNVIWFVPELFGNLEYFKTDPTGNALFHRAELDLRNHLRGRLPYLTKFNSFWALQRLGAHESISGNKHGTDFYKYLNKVTKKEYRQVFQEIEGYEEFRTWLAFAAGQLKDRGAIEVLENILKKKRESIILKGASLGALWEIYNQDKPLKEQFIKRIVNKEFNRNIIESSEKNELNNIFEYGVEKYYT